MTTLQELLETLDPEDVQELDQEKDPDDDNTFCHTVVDGYRLCGKKAAEGPTTGDHDHVASAVVCAHNGKQMCPSCRQLFLLNKLNKRAA